MKKGTRPESLLFRRYYGFVDRRPRFERQSFAAALIPRLFGYSIPDHTTRPDDKGTTSMQMHPAVRNWRLTASSSMSLPTRPRHAYTVLGLIKRIPDESRPLTHMTFGPPRIEPNRDRARLGLRLVARRRPVRVGPSGESTSEPALKLDHARTRTRTALGQHPGP